MNVYLHSLGCRLNQSELEEWARQLTVAGYHIVDDAARADVGIVNTCAVTQEAERKSRRSVRSLSRANPEIRIAVVGCYATLAPRRCADLPGVDWVIPNDEKERTMDVVAPPLHLASAGPDLLPWRTRAFVKVQDGCDNHCTYCIVRLLRGPSRSRPVSDIVAQVQARVEEGCQEVVLTGVNLGAYGREWGEERGLYRLVNVLLAQTDLPRLRLSSLEPWDLDVSFFALWENPRLCRQLHIPLQAGCDETLRRMGRQVTTAEFASLVAAARAGVPDLAVTTDLIVGFPGEDEAAFRASYEYVAEIGFARLHVFPYSPRPGTPAARLSDQVARGVQAERARAMRSLGADLARCFRRRFVGRDMVVLWEQQREGLWTGLTDNYLRVVTRAEGNLHNHLTLTYLVGARNGVLVGEVLS
ncbi:MAG TPA: tRNA (N(6)-L-threonylcarbamoyladenosine(37)-C(2))-methylthiotransferase MtaB [Chloroflexi bacterium]|nr:tRNA (N(6)-L-threonylcarbamoyladenosine(37)-C(2))-methylthiotransferase MtaB [Chloroflexota bacterium]